MRRLTMATAGLSVVVLAAAVPQAQNPNGIPEDPCHLALALSLTQDRKFFVVDQGEWKAPFVVVAGIGALQPVYLPNGLRLEFLPTITIGTGEFDVAGRAFVPIDLQVDDLEKDLAVNFQAVTWLNAEPLPDNASNALVEPLTTPDTTPPVDPPAAAIWVRPDIEEVGFEAALVSTDGIPPDFHAVLTATTPTGGYRFTVKSVRWYHDFARIGIAMERPAPGAVVTEGFVTHRAVIALGHRVERAEIEIHAFAGANMPVDVQKVVVK